MRKKFIIIVFILLWLILIYLIIQAKLTISSNYHSVNKLYNDSSLATIVYGSSSKKIYYEKNAHLKLPPASITKLLTCITVLENVDINKYIFIKDYVNEVIGSKIYLQVGDLVKVEDLLYGLILQSGNDAAIALNYSYSNDPRDLIIKMNNLCEKLKLKNSIFYNTSGLDESESNITTCYDMAVITSYGLNNKQFKKIVSTKKYSFKIIGQNGIRQNSIYHKHRLLLGDSNVIGGKTGYTKKAHRTLVTIFDGNEYAVNEEIIIVTMNAYDDWNLHLNLFNHYIVNNEKNA